MQCFSMLKKFKKSLDLLTPSLSLSAYGHYSNNWKPKITFSEVLRNLRDSWCHWEMWLMAAFYMKTPISRMADLLALLTRLYIKSFISYMFGTPESHQMEGIQESWMTAAPGSQTFLWQNGTRLSRTVSQITSYLWAMQLHQSLWFTYCHC